jgi:hypothetical protein
LVAHKLVSHKLTSQADQSQAGQAQLIIYKLVKPQARHRQIGWQPIVGSQLICSPINQLIVKLING